MVFTSHLFILSITLGLVIGKPLEEKSNNGKSHVDPLIDQAFRKAEMTLNHYFYRMDSDTDQLVHAMLHILMNNPTLFPYVPHQALDVAFKNVAKKLGPSELDTLTKPMMLTMEKSVHMKSKQPKPFELTEEIKDEIENALDKFLEETEEIDSHN
jgi:hypothetical protein